VSGQTELLSIAGEGNELPRWNFQQAMCAGITPSQPPQFVWRIRAVMPDAIVRFEVLIDVTAFAGRAGVRIEADWA
jgi:hypothetical protein